MSTNIVQDGRSGLLVTGFCGPERDDGGDRRRFEIVTDAGYSLELSAEEWRALAEGAATWREREARVREMKAIKVISGGHQPKDEDGVWRCVNCRERTYRMTVRQLRLVFRDFMVGLADSDITWVNEHLNPYCQKAGDYVQG